MKGSCHHRIIYLKCHFFAYVQIKAVEDMVCGDITLFQEIWEQTNEEQKEASLLDIRRYLQCHEDINTGWINVCWGVLQVLDVSCRNPNLRLATKTRACKGASQEGSPGVTSHAHRSVRKCEGMNLHTPK
jgi:hypothetical protein